jgi:hypothetical protein
VESTATVAQPLPVKPRVAEAKAAARTPPPKQTDKATDKPADTKQASSRPNAKPAAAADATASSVPGAPAPAEAKEGLVAGSQPIVSANSFESRFSATK